MNEELESLASRLEESGNYRVLRRLKERDLFSVDDGNQKRIGLILDVETTGLDPTRDEIIELAMLKFDYGSDGSVFRVLDQFSRLREPTVAIPIEITKLTGIAPEMVAGKTITQEEIEHFASSAAVLIAHNAGFDRRFFERTFPVFNTKHWACSMSGARREAGKEHHLHGRFRNLPFACVSVTVPIRRLAGGGGHMMSVIAA